MLILNDESVIIQAVEIWFGRGKIMIVGCYSIHLYCDDRRHNRARYPGPDEFTGETAGEARKAARADGWKIRSGIATCPRCAHQKILDDDLDDKLLAFRKEQKRQARRASP